MYLVQNHLRASVNIGVFTNHEDCCNEQEYLKLNIMLDVMSRHGEEVIDNPHVDKNNPDIIIHPKSYIIQRENILSFNDLPVSDIHFISRQSPFNRFRPRIKYDEMTNNDLQIILRIIIFSRCLIKL
jgi:hypothetical protein